MISIPQILLIQLGQLILYKFSFEIICCLISLSRSSNKRFAVLWRISTRDRTLHQAVRAVWTRGDKSTVVVHSHVRMGCFRIWEIISMTECGINTLEFVWNYYCGAGRIGWNKVGIMVILDMLQTWIRKSEICQKSYAFLCHLWYFYHSYVSSSFR